MSLHAGNTIGTTRSPQGVSADPTKLEHKVGPNEAIVCLSRGATELTARAERFGTALGQLTKALSVCSYQDSSEAAGLQHAKTDKLWTRRNGAFAAANGDRDIYEPVIERCEKQLGEARRDFVISRADKYAENFANIDRALRAVIDVIKDGPDSENRLYRIEKIREQVTKNGAQAAESFAALHGKLGGKDIRNDGDVVDSVFRIEEQAFRGELWEVARHVLSEAKEALVSQARGTLAAVFDGTTDYYGDPLSADQVRARLTENKVLYGDNALSPLVHSFVTIESRIGSIEGSSPESFQTVTSWACEVVGKTSPKTGDVSLLHSLIDQGPKAGYSFVEACRRLGEFGWQTNALFDRTGGEQIGNDSLEDRLLAARSSSVDRLLREVKAEFKTAAANGRWSEEPFGPLATLASFGCQGLAAAVQLANQNILRPEFVSAVLEHLRQVADPRPGGNVHYLTELASQNILNSPEPALREEALDLCVKVLDTTGTKLGHEALWTLIRLDPASEDVRAKVRGILDTDEGCREHRLVGEYQKLLGISDEELGAASARAREISVGG